MRDLGVIMDVKVNFREHVDCIAKIGSQLAGFLPRQTKFFRGHVVFIILYNCYMCSTIEYYYTTTSSNLLIEHY